MDTFRPGQTLARSFATWLGNLLPFTLLSLVCFVPYFAFVYLALHGGLTMKLTTFGLILTVLNMLLTYMTTAAISYGVFQQLRGQPVPLGEALSKGVRRILPVIGTSILAGLAIGVSFIFLVVPGLIVACILYVAVPAAVVEKKGAFEALVRSGDLTQGHRFAIFGMTIVTSGLPAVIGFIYQKVAADHVVTPSDVMLYFLGNGLLASIFASLTACAASVAYHDLRRAKEGVDVTQLAAIFE